MILLSLTGFFSPLFSEKSQSYLTSWQNIILLVNHTKSLNLNLNKINEKTYVVDD